MNKDAAIKTIMRIYHITLLEQQGDCHEESMESMHGSSIQKVFTFTIMTQ
jgi:hypothetical protein